ncbi:MAG: RNA methyltransferase [Bdellovibrionota bacterium]
MISKRFPHDGKFSFGEHVLTSDSLLELVAPYLTSERQKRIEETVRNRTCNVVPVLENIYDRGNVSAVLRSAEGMGFQCAHVIEGGERFKKANRVTQGADKWLDVKKWQTTTECVRELKRLDYQILVTHLDANAVSIADVDVTKPTAIVFGNEKDGVSKEMIEAADKTVIIPMQGFVQSFNISVAAAIGLYHIYSERMRKLGRHGDMSEAEMAILRAEFSLRSSKNPERLVEEIIARQTIKS